MKTTKKALWIVVCFAMVFSLFACSMQPSTQVDGEDQQQEGEKPVIGASILSLEHPFYITYKEGLEKAAAEMGAELVCTDAQFDVAKQLSQIDDLITQDVDAIILTPVEANASIEMINMCVDAGIPVIIQATPVESDKVATQVVTDNIELGYLLGKNTAAFINEKMDGKANIALLNYPTFTDCKDQEAGFIKGIEEFCPDAEFIASIPSASKEDGLNAMEDVLQAHPEVNLVFAINDPVGLGAVQAIEASGRDDIYAAFLCGGDQEAFERLQKGTEEGRIIGIVQLYPMESGRASIKAALDAINGVELDDYVYTEGRFWDENNVEENLKAYPEYPAA